CSRIRRIFRRSPASGARPTAAPTRSCIWREATSTAAGSSRRGSNPAARAAARLSTSFGNVVIPQDDIKQYGADILRMRVCAADYADDLRIGAEILKGTVETYR